MSWPKFVQKLMNGLKKKYQNLSRFGKKSKLKKCKKRKWYDPRGWFCWLVTILVKVVRIVVVTVGKWVVRTVCKIITLVITLVVEVVLGLVDIVVGIFTLDWRRILDGLIRIGIAIVEFVISSLRIIFFVDTIDFILDEINRFRLKKYVKGLLEDKYEGDTLENIKLALRVDHGAFGFRINMSAIRTFLDSETPSARNPNIPNLVDLHEQSAINLYELCGFEFTEGFWNRKRYKTLKKGLTVAGGGGGEFDNPISKSELEKYLETRGAEGPKFIVLCMRDKVLDTKLNAFSEKARELGLIPNWETKTIEVISASHIVHNGFDTNIASSSLVNFLIEIIERKNINNDEPGAIKDLCNLVAVGVFRYTDTLRGIAACLKGSSCQTTHFASGVTFIDNKPDIVWKYVPIHEIGHFFGLCHVDGLDRIMFSPKQNSWFKLRTFPNLLLHGEPKFILNEAKQAWDYIVEHYSPNCLAGVKEDIIIID